MGSRRGSFPKVHSFVLAMLVADEDETTTADAGVVRTDDANAKDCADQCIDCITLDVCQSCEYQDNFTWGDLHPLPADLGRLCCTRWPHWQRRHEIHQER